ncbi:MAG: DUF2231 domain-containing protein [Myxococcota bacterium]
MTRRLSIGMLLVLLAALATAGAHAHKAPSKIEEVQVEETDAVGEKINEVGDIEHIENIEDLDGLEEVTSAGSGDGFADLIGRFHPSMVHVPIGWMMLLALVELAVFLGGRKELERAGFLLLLGTAAAFLPAIATGLLRLSHLPQDPASLAPALLHRNILFAAFAMLLLATGLRVWRRSSFTGAVRHAYIGFIIVAAALVAAGAHLGGKLVYGEGYLPF